MSLRLHGVGQRWGDRLLFEGVELHVGNGESLVIAGPSGSGKTTLLHIAAGLMEPCSGRVEIAGSDPYAAPDRAAFRLRHVGLVFQDLLVFEHLDVSENLEVVAAFAPIRADGARISRLLALVGLSALRASPIRNLSRGERQRLVIARACVGAPHLLLMDEPTASLDSQARDELLPVIRCLAEEAGAALIVTTHDPAVWGHPMFGRRARIVSGRWIEEST